MLELKSREVMINLHKTVRSHLENSELFSINIIIRTLKRGNDSKHL